MTMKVMFIRFLTRNGAFGEYCKLMNEFKNESLYSFLDTCTPGAYIDEAFSWVHGSGKEYWSEMNDTWTELVSELEFDLYLGGFDGLK